MTYGLRALGIHYIIPMSSCSFTSCHVPHNLTDSHSYIIRCGRNLCRHLLSSRWRGTE
jgi:hypothetical protein